MTTATPTSAMTWSAGLEKRGFQVTGPDSIVSPNGTVFTSQEEAWAYVQRVEADALRLHALWRASHQAPAQDAEQKADDAPRGDGLRAGLL